MTHNKRVKVDARTSRALRERYALVVTPNVTRETYLTYWRQHGHH